MSLTAICFVGGVLSILIGQLIGRSKHWLIVNEFQRAEMQGATFAGLASLLTACIRVTGLAEPGPRDLVLPIAAVALGVWAVREMRRRRAKPK
jgi:hypothetical protein